MREHGFNVGGEQSGHIVLSDYGTTGDGLIAALQVLAVIQESGRRVSEVCRVFEPLPQLLKNVRVRRRRSARRRSRARRLSATAKPAWTASAAC